MSFEKLTIKYEERGRFTGRIQALFNPTELTFTDRSNWQPIYSAKPEVRAAQVRQEHHSSPPKTLRMDLFFDAYERGIDAKLLSEPPPMAAGVLVYTEAVAKLTRVQKTMRRPPICELWWGKIPLLRGVLQEATQTLLMFREDGTPVRASVSCTFLEFAGDEADAETNLQAASTGTQLHIVKEGDTLMGIAAQHYGNPGEWRRIASANNIDDPRVLTLQQALFIPPGS